VEKLSLLEIVNKNLPEIKGPAQKRLPFNEKLKWTLIVLVAFFILSVLPLYGMGKNNLEHFEMLSLLLGASFGSVLSLGIGPIVTGSIVLQLLKGAGILKLDTHTPEGRQKYEGLQKLLSLFFIVFEALIYILMGGLAPASTLSIGQYRFYQFLLVLQLIIGGIVVLYLDQIISKWGFGSGISLFIAANVSAQIFIGAFSPFAVGATGATFGSIFSSSGLAPTGKVWVLIGSLINPNSKEAILALSAIVATIIVFLMSVYAQAMKVEIPLSFGRVRGHGVRWPLRFMYTSNIPVILTAALMANVQLMANLLQKSLTASTGFLVFLSKHVLGQFSGSTPQSGLVYWLSAPDILRAIIQQGGITGNMILQVIIFTLFMMIGAVVFSLFWVQTSGMDAQSQASNILSSGLQIPGFRRDERVVEHLLSRYILPLTIMGALTVGFLASAADLMGALSRGTGILLTVMIIYNLYESIAKEHMMDMYPALRKMMGK